MVNEKLDEHLDEIRDEVLRAMSIYPEFNSFHEGHSIIEEEYDELKAEVWKSPKKRDLVKMREEAVQLAAMATRFLHDLL
jgi:predicted nucleotidyltransferase